jgi:3D (Asp-Asp-Asp) domain-containing protein
LVRNWFQRLAIPCILAASVALLPVSALAAPVNEGKTAFHNGNVKVQWNDELIEFPDAEPYVDENGTLQVPLRFIADKLGFTVDWYPKNSMAMVNANDPDRLGVFQLGKRTAVVDGLPQELDSPPALIDNRAYVPLRILSELADIRVQWDNRNRIAILDADGEYHAPAWYAPDESTVHAADAGDASLIDPATAPLLGKPLTFKATAYSSDVQENGGWGAVDYFGNPLELGTIAVDPSVVPLGSTVYITGYQAPGLPPQGMMAKATDTGSAIKGHHVDIFMPGTKKQSLDFGKQEVKIYVLPQY